MTQTFKAPLPQRTNIMKECHCVSNYHINKSILNGKKDTKKGFCAYNKKGIVSLTDA